MTIKTLTYIHNLMIEAEKIARASKDMLLKARNEAEDNGAPDFDSLDREYKKARERWLEADRMLGEFESQEFR